MPASFHLAKPAINLPQFAFQLALLGASLSFPFERCLQAALSGLNLAGLADRFANHSSQMVVLCRGKVQSAAQSAQFDSKPRKLSSHARKFPRTLWLALDSRMKL